MSNIELMRLNAAKAALQYVGENQIIGIGTGDTVNIFIEQLASIKHKIAGAVASSNTTRDLLKAVAIPVLDFNAVDNLPLYIDSADAFNPLRQLIKGGRGALTREKILAYNSQQFICIVDANKPNSLAGIPLPVEVIPMARSYVARQIVKLGGQPQYRENFITDNGNVILDVYDLEFFQPQDFEQKIKQIVGVVESGLFALRNADIILIGNEQSSVKL